MAKRPLQPPSPKKELSAEEILAGIARLTKRLQEVEAFDPTRMTESCPPELSALETAVTRAIEKTFGESTKDFHRFSEAGRLCWSPGIIFGDPIPLSDYREGTKENIAQSKALLREAIRALQEDLDELQSHGPPTSETKTPTPARQSNRIFVVHGHDDGARESVARFLDKIGLVPVILHEQPNKGRTIVTKFREEAEDIGFAIVLMTPDDVGGKSKDSLRSRARQNVVFELGFFVGALGPSRVATLLKGDVERPSDFDGVVYIPLDQGQWKQALGKELEAAGYSIDWNKVMRS